jgi:hypothetical protein
MSDLQLQLQDDRTEFLPGESVTGTASWQVANPPAKAELSLIWATRGKGTQDMEMVQTIPFSDPQTRDSRPFKITLPESPYSFSGQLISLIWTLELNLDPGDECASVEIVIAPGRKEVALPRIKP